MTLALGTFFLVNLYGCGDVSNKSYVEDIGSKIKRKAFNIRKGSF